MLDVCYVDMDGVLVDFVGGVFELFPGSQPEEWPKGQYDIAKIAGVSTDDLWAEIDLHGSKWWADLEPLPFANTILEIASKHARKVVIMTSPSRSPFSIVGKVLWLQKHFGPCFRDYAMVGCSKGDFAGRDKALIDDNERQIDSFLFGGGYGVLYPAPWNSYGRGPSREWIAGSMNERIAKL